MRAAPLHGLVLAGGRSTRMGADKALLSYTGKPQLDVSFELLSRHCAKTFVSARADQADDPSRARYPLIRDAYENIGPIAGILSALRAHPDSAWLVLACDLPFIDDATLDFLVARRNPLKPATSFLSSSDGLPEPLCAIYEPGYLAVGEEFVRQGVHCPRKVLIRSDTEKLSLPFPRALDNINTRAEYEAVSGSKTVHLRYHAMLREERGQVDETLQTAARTASDLYEELRVRHKLSLPRQRLRVAINDQIASWDDAIKAGDAVAFIPPVSGG